MQVEMTLVLPRDSTSVPTTRHVLVAMLQALQVPDEECEDIGLAVTEACANVVRHAGDGDDFRVTTRIRADRCCEIDVADYGQGFDSATTIGRPAPGPDSERGRGLALIATLTDAVRMDSRPRVGTLVHFEKALTLKTAKTAETPTVPR